MKPQLLSVIVPAFKQEKTIKNDLENINEVLSSSLIDYDFEIICVVDGQVDKTFEKALEIKSPKIKVYSYLHNKGKGYAVRYGIVRSKGNLISFLDAGMEISPESIMMLISHMLWYKADIVVGSKRHPVSRVNYPILRYILSIGYHLLVKILFDLPLTDTQSGVKVFRRDVLEKVLPRLLVKKYAMDIEMLAVARFLGFKRIYEAPIEVKFDHSTSRISWRTVFRMFLDTFTVFYLLRILHYYSDNNKRKWVFDPELQFNVNVG